MAIRDFYRAAFALAATAPFVSAADSDPILFSRTLVETAMTDKETDDKLAADSMTEKGKKENPSPNLIALRPNGSGAYYLYAKNTKPNAGSVLVELKGGPNGEIASRGKAENVPAGQWKLVRFAKPAPIAAAAPAAPAVAPVEPPLPGTKLPRVETGFRLAAKLIQDDGTALLGSDGQALGVNAAIKILAPSEYLEVEGPKFDSNGGLVTLPVKAKAELASPASLKLSFGAEVGAKAPKPNDGVLQRTLTPTPEAKAPAATLSGTIAPGGAGQPYAALAADGIERAFLFKLDVSGSKLIPDAEARVRIVPVGSTKAEAITKPVAAFPVRIETDNARSSDRLELRIRRASDADTDGANEVIRLGGARNETIGVDIGDAGGLNLANKSTDWTKSLDLTEYRGDVLVVARVLDAAGKPRSAVEAMLKLKVDANAPEKVLLEIVGLKKNQHIKGTPLNLKAYAGDDSKDIVKATFFFGAILEDGLFAPDAVKVIGKPEFEIDKKTGKPTEKKSGAWLAAVPLPADKKGETQVGVVLTDTAGNVSDLKILKIELIDAPVDTKKIHGKIEGSIGYADRPQPGLTVTLTGPDGKVKETAKTDEKGKFKFEKLLPGAYKLTTAKTDSTNGLIGGAEVTVEVDATAKAAIELKKIR